MAAQRSATLSTELVHSVNYVPPPDYRSVTKEPEAPAVAVPERAKLSRCNRYCYVQKASLRQHVVFFLALSLASYVGVIVRLSLGRLRRWNGIPYFGAFYAEVVGTAIMGLVMAHKGLLQDHAAVYQGLATGLCGSITTFSSWNTQASAVLLQYDTSPPDNATRVVGWATILLLGLSVPIAALAFGRHVAALSPLSDQRRAAKEGTRSSAIRRWKVAVEDLLIAIAWVVISALVVTLLIWFRKYELLFSVVFATPGTYLRWHLAPLNGAFSHFKMGTFVVNVLGTWLVGAVLVTEVHFKDSLSTVGAAILVGVVNGFCGCLTTVSTFIVELTTLPLLSTYFYSLCSLLLAQIGLLVIQGSYIWTT